MPTIRYRHARSRVMRTTAGNETHIFPGFEIFSEIFLRPAAHFLLLSVASRQASKYMTPQRITSIDADV
jgi:hypothetical protein